MQHILDNPVWNALSSGNSNLAHGNDLVKFYAPEVAFFTGFENYTDVHFNLLAEQMNTPRVLMVVTPEEIVIPGNWKMLKHMEILQMVFDGPAPLLSTNHELVTLKKQHIPAMLALIQLTNPGPFFERTIDFGNYKGIFKNGDLAAITGQRMAPLPYIEVSAVCSHPSHVGHGYAAQLLAYHIEYIKANGYIPFLHVRPDNPGAIKLYNKMGFKIRKTMIFNLIQIAVQTA